MLVKGNINLVTRHGGGDAVSVSVGQVVDMDDELAEKLVKAGLVEAVEAEEPESKAETESGTETQTETEPAKPARRRATKRVAAAPENKGASDA